MRTRTVPESARREAIGRNVLDPAQRPASAAAGRAQAETAADAIREIWS